MRALVALVVAMGLMIVAGVVVVGVTIMHRVGGGGLAGGAAPVVLDEPAGTRIVSMSGNSDALAVLLNGGGPDRIVLLGRGGAMAGRVMLKR